MNMMWIEWLHDDRLVIKQGGSGDVSDSVLNPHPRVVHGIPFVDEELICSY